MGKNLFSFSKKGRPNHDYSVGDVLGSGQFSQVYLCTRKSDQAQFALKKIAKKGSTVDEMVKEVEIMNRISHSNILKLEDVYETDHDLYLVLELATGGELFDQIVERSHYSEADTAALLSDILKCLSYLHKENVVHRDLKPENLLYANKQYETIKIADFGLAKEAEDAQLLFGVCGTPGYMAPEMVRFEGYGKKADIFSLGVILYILLCGFPPFGDEDFEWQFLSPEWDNISPAAKDLVKQMLELNPAKRPSAEECLAHQWLKTADKTQTLNTTQDALRKFNARRRFKKGVTAVRTANFLSRVVALNQSKREDVAKEETAKFFRVYENALSESLKKLEAASSDAPQMFETLAKNPELAKELAPSLHNIFKSFNLMEKDFKEFRKSYAKAFLPESQADVAGVL